MFRAAFTASLFAMSSLAGADPVTLADAKAKNGVQLSAEELKELMPGAKVVSLTFTGTTRRWENDPNGTLVASSDNRGSAIAPGKPVSGTGTWRIGDRGTYCVTIRWPVGSEEWCGYMLKVASKYYAFGRLDDNTLRGGEFEISK